MFDVRHYITRDGEDLIAGWLRKLRDVQAKAAIIRRLNRLEQGNFGDFKPLREGVHYCASMSALATGFTTSDRERR
jgi:putative addiction module killer protein